MISITHAPSTSTCPSFIRQHSRRHTAGRSTVILIIGERVSGIIIHAVVWLPTRIICDHCIVYTPNHYIQTAACMQCVRRCRCQRNIAVNTWTFITHDSHEHSGLQVSNKPGSVATLKRLSTKQSKTRHRMRWPAYSCYKTV